MDVNTLQKQISALRGQKQEFINYFKKHGSLADKARLINEGIWKCPSYDEYGIEDYGYEGIEYIPSSVLLSDDETPESFVELPPGVCSDPCLIKQVIDKWGIEAVCNAFATCSFDGWRMS